MHQSALDWNCFEAFLYGYFCKLRVYFVALGVCSTHEVSHSAHSLASDLPAHRYVLFKEVLSKIPSALPTSNPSRPPMRSANST